MHYVATEYGVAYLHGKTLEQRSRELAKIAHPMHREWLNWCVDKQYWKEWDNMGKFSNQKIENI